MVLTILASSIVINISVKETGDFPSVIERENRRYGVMTAEFELYVII